MSADNLSQKSREDTATLDGGPGGSAPVLPKTVGLYYGDARVATKT
jgi:hypothetical protein